MTEKAEFANHIVDLMEDFGRVEAKRMFGGFGIFHEGLMIGLIADGSFYLKADEQTRELFLEQGSTPFTYQKQDKEFSLSYYLAPESFFEESDEIKHWARLAYDAALRVPRKPEKKKKSSAKLS